MSAVLYSDALAAAHTSGAKPQIRSMPRHWTACLVLGDLLMFLAASLAATQFVQSHWNADVNVEHVKISTEIYAAIWLAIFWKLGLYSRSFALSVRDEFYFTIAALCVGAAPLFLAFSIIPSISTSRATLFSSLVLSIVSVGIFRAVAHHAYSLTTRTGRRIVVIGAPERIDELVEHLCNLGNCRVYWMALRDLDAQLGDATFGKAEEILQLHWFRQAVDWRADQILFTEVPPPAALPHLLLAAAQSGITIGIAPPRIRAHAFSVTLSKAGNQILIVPQQRCMSARFPAESKQIGL